MLWVHYNSPLHGESMIWLIPVEPEVNPYILAQLMPIKGTILTLKPNGLTTIAHCSNDILPNILSIWIGKVSEKH